MNNQNTQTIPKQEGQALAAIPYKKSAFSLIMTVLTWAAAVLSVAVLVFLVVFVLAKGVGSITPDLFSLEYTTENASVIPAIVNTLEMTVIALVIAVPIGICAAIFLVEYTNNTERWWGSSASPPRLCPVFPLLCTACSACCSLPLPWGWDILWYPAL